MSMELFHVDSYIRGYYACMGIWEPKVDELFELKREPQNKKDTNAVAVARQKRKSRSTRSVCRKTASKPYFHPNAMMDNYEVIGPVPKLMAWLTKFLKRPTNSGKVVVKGKCVNRGGGYGLEIPASIRLKAIYFHSNG